VSVTAGEIEKEIDTEKAREREREYSKGNSQMMSELRTKKGSVP
jgi:hypothetical protein